MCYIGRAEHNPREENAEHIPALVFVFIYSGRVELTSGREHSTSLRVHLNSPGFSLCVIYSGRAELSSRKLNILLVTQLIKTIWSIFKVRTIYIYVSQGVSERIPVSKNIQGVSEYSGCPRSVSNLQGVLK